MITLATYRNLMKAELAKAHLNGCGIPAVIADSAFYALGYGAFLGVRLQVRKEDAETARAILRAAVSREPGSAEVDAPMPTGQLQDDPATALPAAAVNHGPVWGLLLAGLTALLLARPGNPWRAVYSFTGPCLLLGIVFLGAWLWIIYGRLSAGTDGEDDQG